MRTSSKPVIALAFGTVVLLLAAACGESTIEAGDGGGEGDGAAAGLAGREFWSTEVIESGVERELVDGTRISLRFDDTTIGASAGCNSMGGTYRADGDVLTVGEMSMTEMGCDPARHDQDEYVAAFLGRSPTVALIGDELRLTADDDEIVLLDTRVANPDRPIIGTSWEVNGFIDGEVAMSFATDSPGTIVFRDATMVAFDGCQDISASVEVSDGSTGGPVEGDGELQFGEIARTGPDDCSQADYVKTFNALFDTGEASFVIDGTQLTILNGNGAGVTLTALD